MGKIVIDGVKLPERKIMNPTENVVSVHFVVREILKGLRYEY